ncbi:MAG: hypothetical protein JWP87_3065 [Labilithrix sp.]|nr:hypothetical protein [Labilithrix sp.]
MSAASISREHSPGATPPRASSLRLVGPGAEHARARALPPLGAKYTSDAAAYAVALGPKDATDTAAVARALPDPETLGPGTLVIVLPQIADAPSFAGRFLAALGRGPTISRALRATALVARGYVRVGAGVDHETRSDLVWGFTPGA